MKNKKALSLVLAAALVLLLGSAFAVSADNVPGSSSDPVVTKSYVDKHDRDMQNTVEALELRIKALESSASGGSSSGGSSAGSDTAAEGFRVVQVAKGQSLLGAEGTEMILRSGTAAVVDNSTNDGVPDLTDGVNLGGGKNITKNHLLLVPREDGRGMACSTDCYVMVKGGYTIN